MRLETIQDMFESECCVSQQVILGAPSNRRHRAQPVIFISVFFSFMFVVEAHSVDRSGDNAVDANPGPPLEMDPQKAADSNAARIFFPEEHPIEPPRRLPLLVPKDPETSTAQLLYSSRRSRNPGPTLLLLIHMHRNRNILQPFIVQNICEAEVTYNMIVSSKQMSVKVLSTITRSVSWISVPQWSRQNTAQRCSSEENTKRKVFYFVCSFESRHRV